MKEKGNKSDNIHKGHRKRVWQELTRTGIDENTPAHKVLELMLFFTIPRKDTNALAHIVLDHFGNSFSKLMEASVEEIIEAGKTDSKDIPKISEYTASHIKLILDFAKYYESAKALEKRMFLTRKEAADFLYRKLMDTRVEAVYLLCMDNANAFLACSKIGEGSEVAVALSSKKLFEKINMVGATKVLLAHNHPKGVAFPSPADLQITNQLNLALRAMGVKLLDHIIVSRDDYVSLHDSAKYNYLFDE